MHSDSDEQVTDSDEQVTDRRRTGDGQGEETGEKHGILHDKTSWIKLRIIHIYCIIKEQYADNHLELSENYPTQEDPPYETMDNGRALQSASQPR